jgi:hypothetical protein
MPFERIPRQVLYRMFAFRAELKPSQRQQRLGLPPFIAMQQCRCNATRAANPSRMVKFSRPTISSATAWAFAKSVAPHSVAHSTHRNDPFVERSRSDLRPVYSLGLARKGETRSQSNPE